MDCRRPLGLGIGHARYPSVNNSISRHRLINLSAAQLVAISLLLISIHANCYPLQGHDRVQPPEASREERAAPTEDDIIAAKIDPLEYLKKFGYVEKARAGNIATASGDANPLTEDAIHEAVVEFQRVAGIPQTGLVDGLTKQYMEMPRCGNQDVAPPSKTGKQRSRRYAHLDSKWMRKNITYRISKYPARYTNNKEEIDTQIEKAFKLWSQAAPIDFVVKREGKVHIDIEFVTKSHGDKYPFDGRGHTLAHAYEPGKGGAAHFDDHEFWTIDSRGGTNLLQVAAHEFGHSLGLGHSDVSTALMAPIKQKYRPNYKLHSDDIHAIQSLYGKRLEDPNNPTTTSTPETEEEMNSNAEKERAVLDMGPKPADLCKNASVDLFIVTQNGSTYVFKDAYFWQTNDEGLSSGYPARIEKEWDGLPDSLDAAFTWVDGKTFFFKDDQYWRYTNLQRDPGYPKPINVTFPGVPSNVDAAFVWGGNKKIYFFKGDKYWRFDDVQEEKSTANQHSKSIKGWKGVPTSGVDTAFNYKDGVTYFFKNSTYYRFDDRKFAVDDSSLPAYPRPTGEWWFGCTNQTDESPPTLLETAGENRRGSKPLEPTVAPAPQKQQATETTTLKTSTIATTSAETTSTVASNSNPASSGNSAEGDEDDNQFMAVSLLPANQKSNKQNSGAIEPEAVHSLVDTPIREPSAKRLADKENE